LLQPLETDPLLGGMGLDNKQTPSATHLVSNEGSKFKQYVGTIGGMHHPVNC